MHDNQGKQIHPGDFFAYSVRDGNSSAMRVGVVIEIRDGSAKTILARHEWIGRDSGGHPAYGWSLIERTQSLANVGHLITLPPEALDQELVGRLLVARNSRMKP